MTFTFFLTYDQRLALKRLIDISMGVITPLSEQLTKPLPNAMVLVTLKELSSGAHQLLPEGTPWIITLKRFLSNYQNASSRSRADLPIFIQVRVWSSLYVVMNPKKSWKFSKRLMLPWSSIMFHTQMRKPAEFMLQEGSLFTKFFRPNRQRLLLRWLIDYLPLCRLFEYLSENSLDFPVVHHLEFPKGTHRYISIKEFSLGAIVQIITDI